jgi:transposase
MQIHGNAKLGPAGRLALCRAVESGMTFRQAAALLHVSSATAHRWWHRYSGASLAKQRSLALAADRSSRPHRSPRLLDQHARERICEARRHTGWGPRLIAGQTGHQHSTVWKVLRRHGLSRRPRAPRVAARRYEWPCPGDLLHMDTARYARFQRPGHRVTGDRSQHDRNWMDQGTRVGYDFAHATSMTTRAWPTSGCTATSALSWLKHYNTRRPHPGIANQPPISRVHNLHGQGHPMRPTWPQIPSCAD